MPEIVEPKTSFDSRIAHRLVMATVDVIQRPIHVRPVRKQTRPFGPCHSYIFRTSIADSVSGILRRTNRVLPPVTFKYRCGRFRSSALSQKTSPGRIPVSTISKATSYTRGLAALKYCCCSSCETIRIFPGPSAKNSTSQTGFRSMCCCRFAKFRIIRKAAKSRLVPAAEISAARETLNFSTSPAEIPSSRYLPKNGTRAFVLTPYRT